MYSSSVLIFILGLLLFCCLSFLWVLPLFDSSLLAWIYNNKDYFFDLSIGLASINISIALIVFTREKIFFGKRIRKIIIKDFSFFWRNNLYVYIYVFIAGLILFLLFHSKNPKTSILLIYSICFGTLFFFYFMYLTLRDDSYLIFRRTSKGKGKNIFYKRTIFNRSTFLVSRRVSPNKTYTRDNYFFEDEFAYILNMKKDGSNQIDDLNCLEEAIPKLKKYIQTSDDFESFFLFVRTLFFSDLQTNLKEELLCSCFELWQSLLKKKIVKDAIQFSKMHFSEDIISSKQLNSFLNLCLEFWNVVQIMYSIEHFFHKEFYDGKLEETLNRLYNQWESIIEMFGDNAIWCLNLMTKVNTFYGELFV